MKDDTKTKVGLLCLAIPTFLLLPPIIFGLCESLNNRWVAERMRLAAQHIDTPTRVWILIICLSLIELVALTHVWIAWQEEEKRLCTNKPTNKSLVSLGISVVFVALGLRQHRRNLDAGLYGEPGFIDFIKHEWFILAVGLLFIAVSGIDYFLKKELDWIPISWLSPKTRAHLKAEATQQQEVKLREEEAGLPECANIAARMSRTVNCITFGFLGWIPIFIKLWSLPEPITWSIWHRASLVVPSIQLRLLQAFVLELALVGAVLEWFCKRKATLRGVLAFSTIGLVFLFGWVFYLPRDRDFRYLQCGYWYFTLLAGLVFTPLLLKRENSALLPWLEPLITFLRNRERTVRKVALTLGAYFCFVVPICYGINGTAGITQGLIKGVSLGLFFGIGIAFAAGLDTGLIIGLAAATTMSVFAGGLNPIIDPLMGNVIEGKLIPTFAYGLKFGTGFGLLLGFMTSVVTGVGDKVPTIRSFGRMFEHVCWWGFLAGFSAGFLGAVGGAVKFGIGVGFGTWLGLIIGFWLGFQVSPGIVVFKQVFPYLRLMWVPTIGFGLGYAAMILFFAGCFASAHRLDPLHAFTGLAAGAIPFSEFLYFSMLNAFTLGYSPLHPASRPTQFLVFLEGAASLFWVVLVFAAVIAYLQPRFESQSKGVALDLAPTPRNGQADKMPKNEVRKEPS